MKNDRWYKRIAWTLFFAAILFGIFYLIEVGVNYFHEKWAGNDPIVSFDKAEYTFTQGETITLDVVSNQNKFSLLILIDETDLGLTFKDTTEIQFEFDIPGTYVVQGLYTSDPAYGKEKQVLFSTKLIILPKE